MEKIKKKMPLICAVVAVVLFLVTMNWDLKHIEDTNGPDNYALTTITNGDVLKNKMGALNPYGKRNAMIGDGIVISSNKFTGVTELFYNNFFGKSDVSLDLSSFAVKEGNLELFVVHEGEIIERRIPDEYGSLDANILLRDIDGRVSIMIAGESADYSFSLSPIEYDQWQSQMKH